MAAALAATMCLPCGELALNGVAAAQSAPAVERRSTVCTQQYAPVCARRGAVDKTYPNECFASAEGASVISQGPCASIVIAPSNRM